MVRALDKADAMLSADAFKRSIISGAIYHFYHYINYKLMSMLLWTWSNDMTTIQEETSPLNEPVRLMISNTAAGVAGTSACWSTQSRPILATWNPSTSFWGTTALHTRRSLIWAGTGSWMSTPSTVASVFNLCTCASNSSSLTDAGRRRISLLMPGL